MYVLKQMSSTPLAELGGLVVPEGKSLIVLETLGNQMKTHYGDRFIHVGDVEKERLQAGKYELSDEKIISVAPVMESVQGDDEKPEKLGANKSMVGKTKGKVKAK